jgi:hypothetical protein
MRKKDLRRRLRNKKATHQQTEKKCNHHLPRSVKEGERLKLVKI